MAGNPRGKAQATAMRMEAERRLGRGLEGERHRAPIETDRLVHELRVHQIELEMQNEELRRSQAEAEASRNRYAALYDHAPVGYLTVDVAGNVEQLNLTAAAMLGVERSRIVGTPLARFVESSDVVGWDLYRREVFARTTKLGCELTVRPRGRPEFPAHLESIAEMESATLDGPRRCQVVLIDRSEVRRAEEAERALQESETRFHEIAEHVEDLFYVREPSGTPSYVSPGYERIWGRPAAELAGNRSVWLETIHPEDRERVAKAWQCMCKGVAISETYRIRRPDGTTRWVHSRGFPVLDPKGQVTRAVGVVRDITVERKLEEELRQSQKMEAVGTLASGVAHNLRNVLQAVLAFIHIARRKGIDEERAAQALDRALTTAKRGATLTEQLMTFARKSEAAMRPLRLDDVVRETAGLIKPLLGDQIVVNIETQAPDAVVMADPVELEQIMLNLASNARDAMANGGTLTLHTEPRFLDEQTAAAHDIAPGPHAVIIVRDTGGGMDAPTKARIFEPFFTTKDVGKGTGLGLATVFALTRRFGGCVDVESEVGKGTTFTLCFPSLQGSPDSAPLAAA